MSKTVYYNGDIVTVNRENQVADGLLVEDGKIAAVGSREEILALADRDTVKIDLEGRALLPGFIDPHSHIAMVSQAMLYLDLSGCGSISQLLDLLRTRLRDGLVKPGEWIIGSGYDNTRFPGQQHPTKFDLDSVTEEVPIFLSHTSGHLAAVNSAALQRLGYVGQDYAVPAGGVVRTVSPDSREPNGILEENACLAPEKKKLIPAPTLETLLGALERAQDVYAGYGITTAQDASVDKGVHQTLLAAASAGKLKLDIVGQAVQSVTFDLLQNEGTPRREYRGHYKLLGGKTWLDGSPQGKTAWLTQPYFQPPEGQGPDYRGYGTQTDQAVTAYFRGCIARNLQVNVHANGDAAADQMIRCYRKALELEGPHPGLRPVMVHAQTVREDQLDEMKALGILPTFFLDHIWFWGDYHYESVLGPQRACHISPAGSARDRGISFTLHQDAPVKMPDQILAIHNAVNRKTQKGRVLGEDQRLSVEEALRAVTINGAYQYFEEDQKGSLEPGKLADLVILNRSPLKTAPEQLKDIQVLETIKEGRTIYQKE